MHAVNNGFSFLMLLLFPNVPANASLYDIAGSYYFFIYMGALLLSIIVGYGVWTYSERRGCFTANAVGNDKWDAGT
jgi:hypothetical protein